MNAVLFEDTGLKHIIVGRHIFSSGDRLVWDADGCAVSVRSIEGYYGSPGTNGDIIKNSNGRGSWAAPFTLTERSLGMNGAVFAPNRTALLKKIRAILADIPLEEETAFIFHEESLVMHLMILNGGEQDFDPKGKADGSGLVAEYSMSLVALDPMKLGGDGSDYSFRSETPWGQAASLTYINDGDGTDVPPTVFRVTDCTNPRFTQGGVTQSFAMSIPADQYLEINHETGSVLLVTGDAKTGTVLASEPARGYMTNFWLPLDSARYTVAFDADAFGSRAQFHLLSHHTYN